MDAEKVALGSLLLAVSCVVLVVSGAAAFRGPLSVGALGAIGLSVGTLLADTVSS